MTEIAQKTSLNPAIVRDELIELKKLPGVNISLMAEGPVYKGLEDPKIYRSHDLSWLGVLAGS